MTNPILTITAAGDLEPADFFVMIQGGNFFVQNNHTREQTVYFSVGGALTRELVVAAEQTSPALTVDFVADNVSTTPSTDAGPETGVTVKQMSETGTKCGIGFVASNELHRVVTNTGIAAIQVRSSPDPNYTHEFRIYACADGTFAIASRVGVESFTWSRVPGTSSYPEVIKYTEPLQDTMFFKPTLSSSGGLILEPDHLDKKIVHDGNQGLCLKTTSGSSLALLVTPAAFPTV